MPDLYEDSLVKQAADAVLSENSMLEEATPMSQLATLRKQAAGILALATMMQDEKLAGEAATTAAELVKLAESEDDEDLAQALDLLEQISDQAYTDDDLDQIEAGEADGEIDGDLASLASVVAADELEKIAGEDVRGLCKLASRARTALHAAATEAAADTGNPFAALRKQAAGIIVLADAMQDEKLANDAIDSVDQITKLAESDDDDEQAAALALLEQIADDALGESVDEVEAGEADDEIADGLASLASVDAADSLEKIAGEGGVSLAKLASKAYGAMQKVAMYKVAVDEACMVAGFALGAVSGANQVEDDDYQKAANAMELAAMAKQAAAEIFVEAELAEDDLFGQEKTAAPANYLARMGGHAKRLGARARGFMKDVAGRGKQIAHKKGLEGKALQALQERAAMGSYGTGELAKQHSKRLAQLQRIQARVRTARRSTAVGGGGALALGTGAYGAAKLRGRRNKAAAEISMDEIEFLKEAAIGLWKEADLLEEAAGELLVPDEQLELLDGSDEGEDYAAELDGEEEYDDSEAE